MSDSKKKLCFVIMPFRDELKAVYGDAIRPACEKAGFTALRVDELKGVFNINKKIIQHIFKSKVMIADLTGHNPNVFYEMGVAHAIDNKTIMIIQKDYPLPFDVSTYNCILYEPSEGGLKILADRLVTALRHLEHWRQEPSNPVQDYKPSDAFIPKAELEKLHKELVGKEEQLRNKEKKIASLRERIEELQTINVSKEKTSVIKFRSEPVEKLSLEDVKRMLVEREFFDNRKNKNGRGFLNNFKTLQDGQVVFDHASGLMWQQAGSKKYMTHKDTKKYIDKLNDEQFAGYSDWRLPTLEEAMSLMETEQKNENLYIDPVFDKTQRYIWTSDLFSASRAWLVTFGFGYCNYGDIGYYGYYVRAVRFRQSVDRIKYQGLQQESEKAQAELKSAATDTNRLEALQKELTRKETENQSLHQQIEKRQTKADSKKEASVATLRSQPVENLSGKAVTKMLKKYDFYCKKTDWSKAWTNPTGKGIKHDFEPVEEGKIAYDKTTGLMWQQSGSPDTMTYENAKKFIEKINREKFASYNDWRLPTLEEAMSLMEPTEKHGNLYIDLAFDKTQRYIWTADLSSASVAWVVHFNGGACNYSGIGDSIYVRAVRSNF